MTYVLVAVLAVVSACDSGDDDLDGEGVGVDTTFFEPSDQFPATSMTTAPLD